MVTSEAHRARVFDHWHYLERLCHHRFPDDENLAHEGLLFVLDKLEANDWSRVRAWSGEGRFCTFLTVVGARLLTDFTRARFGHTREPRWLQEKADPLWHKAYRLLVVRKLTRREAIELLQTNEPSREPWLVQDVVRSVLKHCGRALSSRVCIVPLDGVPEPVESGTGPFQRLAREGAEELLEVLRRYLGGDDLAGTPPEMRSARVGVLLKRLRAQCELSAEDRMLLRLRHLDGVAMSDIKRRLRFQGDLYKRYHKTLRRLRNAFERANLQAV